MAPVRDKADLVELLAARERSVVLLACPDRLSSPCVAMISGFCRYLAGHAPGVVFRPVHGIGLEPTLRSLGLRIDPLGMAVGRGAQYRPDEALITLLLDGLPGDGRGPARAAIFCAESGVARDDDVLSWIHKGCKSRRIPAIWMEEWREWGRGSNAECGMTNVELGREGIDHKERRELKEGGRGEM